MKDFGDVFLRHMNGKAIGWYFKCEGKQVKVASREETREEANQQKQIWLELHGYLVGKNMDNKTCQEVFTAYLSAGMDGLKPKTRANRRWQLAKFLEEFGKTTYNELNYALVRDWIEHYPTWTQGGKRQAAQGLKAALNWLRARDRLSVNKLEKVKFAEPKTRRIDFAMGKDVFVRIRDQAESWLKDILNFLWLTGCRPSECLTATAAEYDPIGCQLVKVDHKTKHKGCERRIVLNGEAREMVERLVKLYPEGRLFRGRDGGCPTVSYVNERLKETALKAGIDEQTAKKLTCYSMRHAFAVDLLKASVPVAKVASYLGHGKTRLVEDTYGHIRELANKDDDALTKLDEFRKGK